ncbi:MAG TPA: hypothetical protein VG122_07190 [Gemmata sp.]|jgi:hypothetical protein|nr:hypothetical protein [Gemmata sp.]
MKLFILGLAAAAAMMVGTSTASAQYVVYPAAAPVIVAPPPPPVYAPGVAVGVSVPGVSVSGVIGGPPVVNVGVGLGGFVGGVYRPYYGHPFYGPYFRGYRR